MSNKYDGTDPMAESIEPGLGKTPERRMCSTDDEKAARSRAELLADDLPLKPGQARSLRPLRDALNERGYAALAADPDTIEQDRLVRDLRDAGRRQQDWAQSEGADEPLIDRAARRTGGRAKLVAWSSEKPTEFSPEQAVRMLAVQQARRELAAVRSIDEITAADIIVLADFILGGGTAPAASGAAAVATLRPSQLVKGSVVSRDGNYLSDDISFKGGRYVARVYLGSGLYDNWAVLPTTGVPVWPDRYRRQD